MVFLKHTASISILDVHSARSPGRGGLWRKTARKIREDPPQNSTGYDTYGDALIQNQRKIWVFHQAKLSRHGIYNFFYAQCFLNPSQSIRSSMFLWPRPPQQALQGLVWRQTPVDFVRGWISTMWGPPVQWAINYSYLCTINHSEIGVICTNLAIKRGPHIVSVSMRGFFSWDFKQKTKVSSWNVHQPTC